MQASEAAGTIGLMCWLMPKFFRPGLQKSYVRAYEMCRPHRAHSIANSQSQRLPEPYLPIFLCVPHMV